MCFDYSEHVLIQFGTESNTIQNNHRQFGTNIKDNSEQSSYLILNNDNPIRNKSNPIQNIPISYSERKI